MSRTTDINFENIKQGAGGGASARWIIGPPELRSFDPFLSLNEFKGQQPVGLSDHPHRGFETMDYVLKGEGYFEDFMNNKGTSSAGDVQCMTAGRGYVHCEMFGKVGETHGLQLRVNLKRSDKMVEPSFRVLKDKKIPRGEKEGVKVKVIAGEAFGVKSPVHSRTPVHYLDFRMSPGSRFDHPVPPDWNALVYILSGEAWFGPAGKEFLCKAHHTTTFKKDGSSIQAHNKGDKECRFIMISGKPIGEPVVEHGAFVMNTREEVRQSIDDYRNCRNGFERARTWKSEYARGKSL